MLRKTHSAPFVLALLASMTLSGCGGPPTESLETREIDGPGGNETLTVEVWADNWFALSTASASSGARLLAEDSVPFDTERSFNGERLSFSADLPLVLSFVARDYLENDSGLEYIGSGRQQMGDGGFIFQVIDEDGRTLAVSDAGTRCLVVHRAPLDKTCESSDDPDRDCRSEILDPPAGWQEADFDDSSWPAATVHSVSAVRPKGGYDQIEWDDRAELIWTGDLETDNTILCRVTVDRP